MFASIKPRETTAGPWIVALEDDTDGADIRVSERQFPTRVEAERYQQGANDMHAAMRRIGYARKTTTTAGA